MWKNWLFNDKINVSVLMDKRIVNKIRVLIDFVRPAIRHGWKFGELKKLKHASVLLVCGDDDRGYVWQGKRYAQLLDSINELLREREVETLTLATPYSNEIGLRAFGDVVSVHSQFARAQLRRLLSKVFHSGGSIASDHLVANWNVILRRVMPRIVIAIEPTRELCIAARQLGIVVAELQHGFLAKSIYLYSIAYRQQNTQAGWPDYMLCWDEASAKWIEYQSCGEVKGWVIGHPWLRRFLLPRKTDKLVAELAVKEQTFNGTRPIILVSCQWGHKLFGYHPLGIPWALLDVIKSNRLNCSWLIRLHPVQASDRNRRNSLAYLLSEFKNSPNVFWDPWSSLPLPSVLRVVDLHITSHSSVTLEAEMFRIKTALLFKEVNLLCDFFAGQIERGFAEIVSAEREEILRWIENNSIVDVRKSEIKDFVIDPGLGEFVKMVESVVIKTSETEMP